MEDQLWSAASRPLHGFAAACRGAVGALDADLGRWMEAALRAADPYPPTHDALDAMDVSGAKAIAVGKAAVSMALAWQASGGAPGLAIVPHGASTPPELKGWRVLAGDHPVAGEASFAAGDAALSVAGWGGDVVLLLSGGASAMMEAPTVAPAEHRRLCSRLASMGLPIGTWNAARALLSQIKAGGLAGHVARSGGNLHTLFASDVPGDDPGVVGSGPGTAVAPESLAASVDGLPTELCDALVGAGAQRPNPADSSTVHCVVPRSAPAEAAVRVVGNDGHRPRLLEPMDGPVEETVEQVKRAVGEHAGDSVLVLWGEPLVAPAPGAGPGGRATVLLASLWASGHIEDTRISLAATDGVDGASGLGACHARLDATGTRPARKALVAWRTAELFQGLEPRRGGCVPQRPTGVNCADVGLVRL